MKRGQARFFFFLLIYGLISLLRYYALMPVSWVSLVIGLVWFFQLACGWYTVQIQALRSKLCFGGTIIFEQW